MKYIPADKLIAEIEREIESSSKSIKPGRSDEKSTFCRGEISALYTIKSIITSLQQEQPEVDLEKEIDKYFSRWMQGASDEGCFNANSQLVSIYDCHRIARHFFELGRNARK